LVSYHSFRWHVSKVLLDEEVEWEVVKLQRIHPRRKQTRCMHDVDKLPTDARAKAPPLALRTTVPISSVCIL
jgi:hypothetical protein